MEKLINIKKEKIKNKIIITKTIEIIDEYDINKLSLEQNELEEQINIKPPTDQELIEFGKYSHPYFMDKTNLINRNNEIKNILNTIKD